ncbi:hypothetical protein K469DRAFT_799415 [Zopfia rhizophila CBS 207.26]|uniref:Uncharacterized protein n=1 Tax=Zopfia rhizophila CBS 207.26 TaxID=1314779 RepID=A0A6A6DJW1_9PEZI|nr:hypothetical protein K469DRAFT_799415 [Zopfia rhizophila CBS 207.26]
MRFTTLATILAASTGFVEVVMADNCYGPWNWCGWDLIKHGDYKQYIIRRLKANNKPTDDYTINNSLWHCVGDAGQADFVSICHNGCVYGGSANSNDYCAANAVKEDEKGEGHPKLTASA